MVDLMRLKVFCVLIYGFVRSPVFMRLLYILVQKTFNSQGKTITKKSLRVIFMKMSKISIILSLVIIFSVLIFAYCKNNAINVSSPKNLTSMVSPKDNDKSDVDMPTPITEETTGSIIHNIDDRVSWIKECSKSFICKEGEGCWDCYDGNSLVHRSFFYNFDHESFVVYNLYYDEFGNLIYADIAHYRSTLYSIYFHNDGLLYAYVDKGSYINGDLAHVEAVIKEDANYAFILEDLALCLEHAYK